jgi:hypothetical protein
MSRVIFSIAIKLLLFTLPLVRVPMTIFGYPACQVLAAGFIIDGLK